MHILVLSPRDPYPPNGGWALAIYQDLVGLASLGHQLHLFAVTELPNPPVEPLQAYCSVHYFQRPKRSRWVRVLGNLTDARPFIISHYDSPELVSAAAKFMDDQSVDVILAQDLAMYPAAAALQMQSQRPVYLRLHNVDTQILKRFAEERKNPVLKQVAHWQARKMARFERQAIEAADGVSAVSSSDNRALEHLLPGLTKPRDIIGFGANLDDLPCQLDGRDPHVIMHLGSLMQYTKLEGMQWFCRDVLPQVRAAHPAVRLELAGHAPPDAFRDLPGVSHLGVVPEALPYLHRGRVFIAPQFVGSGMRLKLLNAMATGNAVVCTGVACEGIPIRDGQHGFIRDDAAGFAQAVNHLLESPAVARQMGLQARQLVEENFDCRVVAEQLGQRLAAIAGR